jgi:hypothetical protein
MNASQPVVSATPTLASMVALLRKAAKSRHKQSSGSGDDTVVNLARKRWFNAAVLVLLREDEDRVVTVALLEELLLDFEALPQRTRLELSLDLFTLQEFYFVENLTDRL